MPNETPPTDATASSGSGRARVVFWLVAGAIYAALGALFPPAFLLGFWESLLFVFVATVLAPKILRRFR